MVKINYASLIKKSIVEGVMNTSDITGDNFNTLYGVLMNTDSLAKLKPFNFIRYASQISDNYPIFKLWLEYTAGNTDDSVNAGRRVSRAIERLSREYASILPVTLSGTNSLGFVFRLFFLSAEESLSLPSGCLVTLMSAAYVLQTMCLMDLLFEFDEINGYSSEELLRRVLSGSTISLNSVMSAVTEKERMLVIL